MPRLPVESLVERALAGVSRRAGSVLDGLQSAVTGAEGLLEAALLAVPTAALVAGLGLLVAWRHGLARALAAVVALHLAGALAVLPAAAPTLATTALAVVVALAAGCPVGVLLRRGSRPLQPAGRALLGLAALPAALLLVVPPLLFATAEPAWGVAAWLAALPPAVAASWSGTGPATARTFVSASLSASREGLARVVAAALSAAVLVELVAGGGLGGLLAHALRQGLAGRAVEAALGLGLIAFALASAAGSGLRPAGGLAPAGQPEPLPVARQRPGDREGG